MKERRKGLLWEMALILLTVAACLYSTGAGNIFGAKVDWSSQHSVFPEYFRQQFYRTGQFFPEFALNIGGGQNIYNFSYYGLFSPVVLIGYLLPNVKMSDYMMVASIVCLAAAVIILYRWLKSREFTAAVSGMTALMFLFAGPMIYQSSHQIMFVNYMPFLCLTFCGIDRYFEQKKSGLLIGGTFLMIMTSFYFSIGGILALGLYGIYRYARTKERAEEMITVKGFLGDGLRFAGRILTAIMLAGVLLVPTAMALLGRSGSKGEKTDIWQLLTPQINLEKFLYGAYGPGLSCLMLIILLTGLFYKKAYEKILSLGCLVVLTVPFFSYLLNGALYIRPKSLIPFLPLLCYLTAKYLEKLKNQKIARIWMLLPCLAIIIYIYLKKDDVKSEVLWKLLLLDAVITLLICVAQAYSAWIRKYLTVAVLGPVILSLIVTGSYSWEKSGNLESRKAYEEDTSRSIGKAVDKAITSDSGFYRVEQVGNEDENAENLNRVWNSEQYITSLYSSSYNADYQNFRKNDFQVEQPYRNFLMQSVSQNPVFRQLMGVKYLISSQNIPGYEKKWMTGGGDVYCNENAAPIAYETDQTMSEAEYDRLDFPYNQLVFTRYAVTKDGTVSAGQVKEKLAEDIEKCDFRIPEKNNGISLVVPTENGYQVKMKKQQEFEVAVPEQEEKDGVLFVQFRIENKKPKEDIEISLEGERNKLSSIQHVYYNRNTVFTYAVGLEKGQKTVRLSLGKGEYTIKDMSAYNGVLNEDMNRAVSKMVDEALRYNQVESVLDAGEEEDIFSPEYFEKLSDVKMPATKLELLIKMIRKQIKEYSKINKIVAKTYQEMLEETIAIYHERRKHISAEEAGATQEQASEDIIKNATEQALQILRQMNESRESFRKIGLTFEEKAFYDILVSLRDQYNFEYGEDKEIGGMIVNDKCKILAKKVKEIIDTKSSFSDWLNNQNVRNQLKLDIKICLVKNGYPPQYSPEVFTKVMEQVENFEENSDMPMATTYTFPQSRTVSMVAEDIIPYGNKSEN